MNCRQAGGRAGRQAGRQAGRHSHCITLIVPALPCPALPCPAAHDLYLVHENKVQHWNSVTQNSPPVMDVSGGVTGAVAPGIGQVQLCTLCAR